MCGALECSKSFAESMLVRFGDVLGPPYPTSALSSTRAFALLLQLPRPRFLEGGARTGALLWSTPPGTALRRVALLFHGAVIIRRGLQLS